MPVGIKFAGKFTNPAGLPVLVEPLPGFLRDWSFAGHDGKTVASVPDLIAGATLTANGGSPSVTAGMARYNGTTDMSSDVTVAHFNQPFTIVVRGAFLDTNLVQKVLFGSTASGQATLSTDTAGKVRGYAVRSWVGPAADNAEHLFIFTTNGAGAGVLSVDGVEYSTSSGTHTPTSGVTGVRLGSDSGGTNHYKQAFRRIAVASRYADAAERATIVAAIGIP